MLQIIIDICLVIIASWAICRTEMPHLIKAVACIGAAAALAQIFFGGLL